ncbi:MAG: ABC transporter permease [Plesiomonas sp.]|uniref:ABC transporter permease n=1 Tax=Plesiomonas sp. TaxID=2486279 RepID=UPI003F376485
MTMLKSGSTAGGSISRCLQEKWLSVCAILLVGLIFIPVVIGVLQTAVPLLRWSVWQSLLAAPQFVAALWLTLSSTVGSTLLALGLMLLTVISYYTSPSWLKISRQLPLFLALPHIAFAVGIAFLVAPSGGFSRVLASVFAWAVPPAWQTIHDPYAITLTLTLALKESWFLLWAMSALLQKQTLQQQLTIARSLGYAPRQIWWHILLPQLLPQLKWPLIAVAAYSISVVDMVLILGPTTPPTLAVLINQWLNDPRALIQQQGNTASLLLPLLLLGLCLCGKILWHIIAYTWQQPRGVRWRGICWHKVNYRQEVKTGSITARATVYFSGYFLQHLSKLFQPLICGFPFALGWFSLLIIALWSVADGWFFPALWPTHISLHAWLNSDYSPLFHTTSIALISMIIALPLALCWLEWGPKSFHSALYFPLIIPALPLVSAQYQVLLHAELDGGYIAVIWSHLLWVFPYMLLILSGPYRAVDPRFVITAKTLGYSHWRSCLYIKWPLLRQPILLACAVGVSVSVAQYLPTLFAGAGKISTVTTEAVTLSAGGNRRILAIQALLQTLIPLCAFAFATRFAQKQKHKTTA